MYRDLDGDFWVNIEKLSSEWLRGYARSERERELASIDAMSRELSACGAGKGSSRKWEGRVARYRQIPKRYSEIIYNRAVGEGSDDDE